MNRNYSLEEFRDRIIAIRSKVPSIAIGSDIMVGFPGESEEEFNCSYNAIKSIPFSYLHVFPFSKRPGTAAFEFPEQVEYMEKKKRAVKMTALGKSMYSDFIQKNIGTTQDLIVESVEDEFISGTTSNYIKVRVPDKNSIRPGSLIKIRVTRGTTGLIEGVPHNES
jgi:threonylcarbamoyladenosine tRNA methylthiotransferase MtaB